MSIESSPTLSPKSIPDKESNKEGSNKIYLTKKEVSLDKIGAPLAYREFSSSLVHSSREYLDQLMWDKNELRSSYASFRHVTRLIDSEIKRVVSDLSSRYAAAASNGRKGDDTTSDTNGENTTKTVLQKKIFVPVDKYPSYNFVGRILGPRGMTAKQLEEVTGCKIMVRGRGSCRTEPLHVLIHCEDYPDKVEAKLQRAIDRINDLLSPPPEGKDELKRKQLIELSIINGTYRPTNATKLALQTPRLCSSFNNESCGPLSLESTSLLHNLYDSSKTRIRYPHTLSFPPNSSKELSSRSLSSSPRPITPISSSSINTSSLLDDNQAYVSSLFATHNQSSNGLSSNCLLADYYRQILAMSLSDSSLLYHQSSDLLSSLSLSSTPSSPISSNIPPPHPYAGGTPSSHSIGHSSSSGLIPPANVQQYIVAAAMLRGVPYMNNSRDSSHIHRTSTPYHMHDGSGDAHISAMHAHTRSSGHAPGGGGVKRA